MEETYTDSIEFLKAVWALRAMPPRFRALARQAADCWTDEKLIERSLRIPVDDEIRGTLQ